MPSSPHTLNRQCAPLADCDDRRVSEQYATADAINAGLRMLRDRPHDNCNGNCTQGRACDCVPDVATNDTKDADQQMRAPTEQDLGNLLGALIGWPALSVIACLVLYFVTWPALKTLGRWLGL